MHNSKDMETAQMTMKRDIQKETVVKVLSGILLSPSKQLNSNIVNKMVPTGDNSAQGDTPVPKGQIS